MKGIVILLLALLAMRPSNAQGTKPPRKPITDKKVVTTVVIPDTNFVNVTRASVKPLPDSKLRSDDKAMRKTDLRKCTDTTGAPQVKPQRAPGPNKN